MTDDRPPGRRGLTLQEFGVLVLFSAGSFIVTFFDPSNAWWRVLLGAGAASLVILERGVARRRRRPITRGTSAGQITARGFGGLGLRSQVLLRWPRLADRLPGFHPSTPDRLPDRLSTFRGRDADLDRLAEVLESERLVVLHGMPGVGKSALSQELAHRIKARYPDGRLYENLGVGGTGRDTSAVLKDFLKDLGWREREIPRDPEKRIKLFRTLLSQRRVLILLDGARDPSQVKELLPGGPGCAVIITSRLNLTTEIDGHAAAVTPPTAADATRMLQAYSALDPAGAPTPAAAIVALCGRLPRAIVAAGSLIRQNPLPEAQRYTDVAARLKPEETRLDVLAVEGIDLATDFASEYQNHLTAQQAEALQLLTLVDSPTFVSWTLRPMMNVGFQEAENIVARLRGVHMLETASPTGPSRSRFHALVRLFVIRKRDDAISAERQSAIRANLLRAYVTVVRKVLSGANELADGPQTAASLGLLPPAYVIEHILGHRERWVRDEYSNLLRCLDFAPRKLAWRIARWLGDHVPRGLAKEEVRNTLEKFADDQLSTVTGQQWVRLALAGHAIAIGDYGYARSALNTVLERANCPAFVAAVDFRRQVQLELALGNRTAAETAAGEAQRLLLEVGPVAEKSAFEPASEAGLLDLIVQRGRSWGDPANWQSTAAGEPVESYHDAAQFLVILANAERERRQQHWEDARKLLDRAYLAQRDDAFRLATIEYERARVELSHAIRAVEPERRYRVENAIVFAARAVMINKDMGSLVAELRGRCQLSRALTAGGYHAEATRQAERAEADLRQIPADSIGTAHELLLARIRRARGEALLGVLQSDGTPDAASSTGPKEAHGKGPLDAASLLVDAQELFRRYHEWRAVAELDLNLSRAYRLAGDCVKALERATGALATFRDAQDEASYELARIEVDRAVAGLSPPRPVLLPAPRRGRP